jgi:hypothetical protein
MEYREGARERYPENEPYHPTYIVKSVYRERERER